MRIANVGYQVLGMEGYVQYTILSAFVYFYIIFNKKSLGKNRKEEILNCSFAEACTHIFYKAKRQHLEAKELGKLYFYFYLLKILVLPYPGH